MAHTIRGLRFTELTLLALQASRLLGRAGDALVADLGLTNSRWQVLGEILDRPTTVARIARRAGMARQSIQRTVDRMVADGLVELNANPDHRRSPLLVVTQYGRDCWHEVECRHERWADELARKLDAGDVAAACRVLRTVSVLLRTDHRP